MASSSHQRLPPPAYSDYDDLRPTQFNLYHSQQSTSSSSSQQNSYAVINHFYLFDNQQNRFTFTIRIPKKREGWKAEIFFISEKQKEEKRYEVRRETFARKFDFRPPNGIHNIMTPSTVNSPIKKTFSIESPDGQKLCWRKNLNKINGGVLQCALISLPSNTIIAQFDGFQSNPGGSNNSNSENIIIGSMPARLYGTLQLSPLPANDLVKNQNKSENVGVPPIRRQSQTSLNSSNSSSTQSDHGPRLHGAHKRGISIGICGPSIVAASFGSPLLAAGMNKNCIIGDELSNLGRATIILPLKEQEVQQDHHTLEDSSFQRAAEHWASLNRFEKNTKLNDPRPRRVELDLILASLMAVLTG